MILAAGRGERARPLTDRVPKPLFPVAGRPLIAYALGVLRAAGIDDVVVNVQHLADLVEEQLRGCARLGVRVAISREESRLESGGGIALARELIGNETFIVINSDTICDVDLKGAIEAHRASGAASTMVLRRNPDPSRIPAAEYDPATACVVDVRGALGARSEASEAMMFTGVHVMEPTVFGYVRPVREDIVNAFYIPALRDGHTIHGHLFDGYWADLGTQESYRRVRDEFSSGVQLIHPPLALAPIADP